MSLVRLAGVVVLVVTIAGLVAADAAGEIRSVRTMGGRILVDDRPTRLWGVRVAGAALAEEHAEELLASLDAFRKAGVNALVVCYQGSPGQTRRTFSTDGTAFEDAGVRDRVRRILDAAAARDMIVIVGLFVPRKQGVDAEDPRLASREAYLAATRLAAQELRGRGNVILSIAHEAGRTAWMAAPMRFAPDDAIACLAAAADVAPDVPRGCGGPDAAFNEAVAASPHASVLMHQMPGTRPPKVTSRKPAIQMALLGRDSGGGGGEVQGTWTEPQMRKFSEALAAYHAAEQHHLVAHFAGWTEGGLELKKNRFAAGGMGTAKDPGIGWYLDRLSRQLAPPPGPPRGPGGGAGDGGAGRSIFDAVE